MNKVVKIISTLLIAVLLVATLSQVCLATGGYTNVIDGLEGQVNQENVDTTKINATAAKIIKLIRNVAAVAAVVIVSILGVKYMIGSPEEKSKYKESFVPLIVGVVLVVAATSIATLLFSIA